MRFPFLSAESLRAHLAHIRRIRAMLTVSRTNDTTRIIRR